MELTIRIYTNEEGFNDSKSIKLDENELDLMIEDYLKERGYLKDKEIIAAINYENIKL